MAGDLLDVIDIGTGIASLSNAARSAVSILYISRNPGGLRNHAPTFSEFLILEDLSCFAIYDDRADARQKWEPAKFRVDKLIHF